MNPVRVIKLVRDGIPRLVGKQVVVYSKLKPDEHVAMLRRKLIEEWLEYIEDPSPEELADIVAVCRALANVDLNVSWDEIIRLELTKHADRGGFVGGTGLGVQSV